MCIVHIYVHCMHRCMWVKNRSPGVSGAHFAQDDEILKDMDDKSVHSLAQHGSNSLKKKKHKWPILTQPKNQPPIWECKT